MAIDWASGWILAGVFKKSPKTDTGAINSNVTLKGFIKKGMSLLIVLVGHHLDLALGTDFVRTAVIIAFISSELISIMENAGLMGISWPPVLRKALDVLGEKGDKHAANNPTSKP